MMVMMTFHPWLVVMLLVISGNALDLDSVKFSNLNGTIELKWDNGETDSAVLVDKGDCIYDGQLARDASSSILVTGCKDAFVNVQIQSEPFGDHLFSLYNGTVAYVEMEEHDYDLYPDDYLINDEFPIAAQGNGRLKRALDDYYYYDEPEENPEFENDYNDITESELGDLTTPTNFILNLNVYLDKHWVKKLSSSAETIAKQIMAQVVRLYTHDSLETKIDIKYGNRFYKSSAPHLIANSKTGLKEFKKHTKPPYTIGKDEKVAHVHLTAELAVKQSQFVGKATISGLCIDGSNLAIAAWNNGGTARTAMTVAHEIGHLMGMWHDFKEIADHRKKCSKREAGNFLMDYGKNRIEWSKCSNQDFKTFYQRIVTTKEFCLRDPNLGCQCNGKIGQAGGECEKKDETGRAWCYVDEYSLCSDKKLFWEDSLSYNACGCAAEQFQCDNGDCIPESQHCDGVERNCAKGEDEAGCDPWW